MIFPDAPPAYGLSSAISGEGQGGVPIDTTGDGVLDSIVVDTTGDGVVDCVLPLRENAAAVAMQAAFRGKVAREGLAQRRAVEHGLALEQRASSMEARTQLDEHSAEYKEVASYFESKLEPSDRARLRIASIEKLHVADILQQYELVLAQMRRREAKRATAGKEAVPDDQMELRWVFHACAAEVVDNIICSGFNRSYAGKNATVYGPGSYFARDASYSCQPRYSPPEKGTGLKRIFMCRLALGAHVAVQGGYADKEPPVRDPERLLGVGVLRYDCTTNDRLDRHGIAEIMVAFKDNQAYADYLVTFTM